MSQYIFLFSVSVLWVLITKVTVTSGQENDTTVEFETSTTSYPDTTTRETTTISTTTRETTTISPASPDFNNDFENGLIAPWTETSRRSVTWKIENINSPWESDNVAPIPLNGSSYVRVDRGASLSFGVAILRSPIITVTPNVRLISLSFSFWIRSKWPQFTNLEVYVAMDGKEKLAYSLAEYADINNQAWQFGNFPISPTTVGQNVQMQVVFYAYCGTNVEDAIAIDDISLTIEGDTTVNTPLTTAIETITSTTTLATTRLTLTTRENTSTLPRTIFITDVSMKQTKNTNDTLH